MGVVIPLGFGLATMPFRCTLDPEEMVITIGFQDDPAASANTIATRVWGPFTSTASFATSTGSNLYSMGPGRVTCMRSLGPVEGVDTVTRTFTNAAVPPMPNNCALLVQKRTARGGRKGRGRLFIPPYYPGESNITAAGVITQSLVDAFNTDLELWRAGCITNAVPLYLLHSGPPVGPPLPPDQITALVMQPVIGTQRKRMRR